MDAISKKINSLLLIRTYLQKSAIHSTNECEKLLNEAEEISKRLANLTTMKNEKTIMKETIHFLTPNELYKKIAEKKEDILDTEEDLKTTNRKICRIGEEIEHLFKTLQTAWSDFNIYNNRISKNRQEVAILENELRNKGFLV
jgi:chromosome segregation ATPase